MSKKKQKPEEKPKEPKNKIKEQQEELDQEQKPGLPDMDLKKFMGCGG